jgi:predicted DNA binding CopG/RHH family protein
MKRKHITARKNKHSEIDYSDIPEQTDADLKKFKRVGRPLIGEAPRIPISIRIDEDVLESIKKKAKKKGVPYQSLINEILKKEAS